MFQSLSKAPQGVKTILVVSSFRLQQGITCNVIKLIHFHFSIPYTALFSPLLKCILIICSTLVMWFVHLGIIRGLLEVEISAISIFLCCGIGKETMIWFFSDTLTGQIQVWAGTEETNIKIQVCWREGECERQQSARTLCSKLDSCSTGGSGLAWSAPSEACACFYDCLWSRQGRNEERLGHWRVNWWGRSRPKYLLHEMAIHPTIQDWGGGKSGAGWVRMLWLGHLCLAFGSSQSNHSQLYSICFLECIRALRFRGPLYI